MSELRWEEPADAAVRPTTSSRTAERALKADMLRTKPRKWAVVEVCGTATVARPLAWRIRNGGMVAYRPAGSFEAVARTVDGEHRVYARYVGVSGG